MSIDPAFVNWAIVAERRFQDKKWGAIEDNPHTLGEWILIAESELNEAKLALIKGGKDRDGVRAELIQTAAVIYAALEQHGIQDTDDKRKV